MCFKHRLKHPLLFLSQPWKELTSVYIEGAAKLKRNSMFFLSAIISVITRILTGAVISVFVFDLHVTSTRFVYVASIDTQSLGNDTEIRFGG